MGPELKPCPFCGKIVARVATCAEAEECDNFETCDNCGMYSVFCAYNFGGCGASSGYRSSEISAIELWNRRAYE